MILRASAAAILTACASFSAQAQSPEKVIDFDLPAQNLDDALKSLGYQSERQVMFTKDIVNNKTSKRLSGEMTPTEALDELLHDTGLDYEVTSSDVILIKVAGQESAMRAGRREGGFLRLAQAGAASSPSVSDANEERGLRAETIIVTAQKREQRLSDVPMSIAALTGEQLYSRGISDFADLALSVPGVAVQDTGTSRRITIRGVGNVTGRNSLVGVYLDGASVTGDSGINLDLRTHDLERVEVLRGPQGTLYGGGSSGGTVRFITNRPDLTGFSAQADVSAYATKGGEGSYEVQGVVNIPVVEDRFALRVAGLHVREGGWIDQPARGLEDINDANFTNLRVKALLQPTETLELEASVTIHRNDAGFGNRAEDENGNYEEEFGRNLTAAFEDEYEIYNLAITQELGFAELYSSTSYITSELAQTNRNNVFPSGAQPLPAPRAGTTTSLNKQEQENFNQEVRFTSTGEGPFNWTLGGFYRDYEYTLSLIGFMSGVEGQAPTSSLPDVNQVITSKSWSVFGEASYEIANRLELGAGLRYFEDEASSDIVFVFTNFIEDTFDTLNPRIFARYDVSDDIKLYANVAKGFRSGGFNVPPNSPTFDPEDVWSYEVGTKASFLDGRFDAELTFFRSDYNDIQINGLVLFGGALVNTISNIGAAEIKGVEGLVSWNIDESLSIGFTGSYVDTEVTEAAADNPALQVGDDLTLVPDYNFGGWINYDFYWTAGVNGYGRIDFNQQGSSEYRNRNIGPFYVSESDVLSMLDARIGAYRDNWSVEFFAENLLNERDFIDAISIENAAGRPRPRSIGVRLGLDF